MLVIIIQRIMISYFNIGKKCIDRYPYTHLYITIIVCYYAIYIVLFSCVILFMYIIIYDKMYNIYI